MCNFLDDLLANKEKITNRELRMLIHLKVKMDKILGNT
jgi:hypothetical protein